MGEAAGSRLDTPPSALNAAAAAVIIAANLFLFLGVPALLAAGHRWSALLLLPALLTTIAHWALIHEAVHGRLQAGRQINEAAGRLLAILFLAPFDTLRFGHLSHHALNARPAERAEIYDPRVRSRLRAGLTFYLRLFCGVYLAEVASGLLALLPRRLLRPLVRRVFYEGEPDAGGMAERAERVLLAPPVLRRIRLEALASAALVAASLTAYGGNWPLLALALAGRAFLVSFMDNAPHYDGTLAEPDQGFDMRLPRLLQPLVLNGNLHGAHHRQPNLPWAALPEAFATSGAAYAGSYLLLPWRQLKGPRPLARERLSGRTARPG